MWLILFVKGRDMWETSHKNLSFKANTYIHFYKLNRTGPQPYQEKDCICAQ